ncbi:hypothetical protein EXIGLDRAFT_611545 [Exidia glandulosa HHB12029]|uniref:FAR-17a/AIG1-like protein n=1 Tax=Exidia glandulosa HHB12029 TaxID=1314781 RepID=A0A165JAY5_EXIGL|nr:hypothetical protein EXIGLDRAFT_611545 [Exidia glandulosa HHB12029]
MSRVKSLFRLGPPFDPNHRFETSSVLSPYALGGIRALFAVYGIATIIVSATVRTSPTPAQSFSYFSNITWWGITWYHMLAAFHTLSYARTGRAPLERWWPFLQAAHATLWTTVVTFPLMVTVVFWGMQFTPGKFDTAANVWSNISHHALNSAFAVFEIIFARTERPPLIHGPLVVLLLGGYAGVAYITHATEAFYTYGFLDPSKRGVGAQIGIIIAMGGIVIGLFIAVSCLVWLRLWVAEEKLGLRGKFAERDRAQAATQSVESVELGGVTDKEEREILEQGESAASWV